MAVINVTNDDTFAQFVSDFNSLAAFVGDITGLSSNITTVTDPDTLVTACNYLYTLASTEDTTITGELTLEDNLIVQGTSNLQGTVTCDGSFTFNDTGSAAVTIILDEDNMSSDSATGLATQQSIKAYVDNAVATVDAATLDGVDSTSFMRSDAADVFDSDITTTFGSGSGAIRVTHVSADNTTYFRPNIGSAGFSTSYEFGFDGDTDLWFFDSALTVSGAFTSLGIDDNATSNVFQLENSAITLKQATTVQGNLTVSTGDIIVPVDATTDITNNSGEYIRIDGSSTVKEISAVVDSVEAISLTSTTATLNYGGAAKIATSNTGIDVTGELKFSTNIIGPASFQIQNSGDDYIEITGSTVDFYIDSTKRFNVDAAGADVTGALTVSSTLSAGATTLTGNLTGGNTFTIDNGSAEKIRFSTTQIFLEIADADIVEVNSSGLDVTGDLTVSGNITGTLGNITTGTINSGAITSTGLIQSNTGLTLTGGDIILPAATTAADVGNNAGEYVRFDGTNNETEIRAGGDLCVLATGTETQLLYNGSEKFATTNTGVAVTGALTATGDGTFNTSDARLKTIHEHNALENHSLNIIEMIKPVAFSWNDRAKEINPAEDTSRIRVGVIAQEIAAVLPEAMGPKIRNPVSGEEYDTVNYGAIIPVLINAVKELSERVRELEEGR